MNKKLLLITISLILSGFHLFGQAKIGDNPTIINPNSVLELESSNQGVLMPRVALVQTTNPMPLTQHIAGMTLYNISLLNDVVPGFYYNDGTKWVKISQALTVVNGLSSTTNNEIKLGGNLSEPTTIGTTSLNTLAITGLQQGNGEMDSVVLVDPSTGVLKKSSISSLIIEKQIIHVADDGDVLFNTPFSFSDINKINVYRNGARIGATMVNGTTIQLEAGVVCFSGDEIRIVQIN